MARLVLASGALALGANSAVAQSAVSTLAGTGSSGSANGTGTAASFQFTFPSGAAVDSAGNLYIADAGNHTIRRVTPAGEVTTFAGAANQQGSTNATGAAARFNQPRGIAVDGAGNLYVADTGNHTIRRITPAGEVTTIAGTALSAGADNGTGAAARFNSPMGIATERTVAAVNIYVADTQNHTVRKIVASSGEVTTLAGTAGASGNQTGIGAAARFNQPIGMILNSGGTTLYLADRFNHIIREIAVSNGNVTTLAGSGSSGQADGTGAAASFNNPAGVTIDGSNNILVSDSFNHTIRSVTTAGVVTTIAGLANNSGPTDGLGSAARFNSPSGIAFASSPSAATYVVDTNSQLVRKISAAVAPSITTQPVAASAAVNGSASFTVVASGNPPVTYQWQLQPGGSGSFSNLTAGGNYSGVNSATLTVNNITAAMNNDRFQVVVSNAVGSPATSSAATLTVTQAPAFTSATSANFSTGQTTTFNVTVTGSPAPQLSATGIPIWASFNTSTGVLTGAPQIGDTSATITFTATPTVGAPVTQIFTATVVTTTLPQISGPTNQQVPPGGTTASFSVTATGTPSDFTYQWQRSTNGGASWVALSDTVVDGAIYSGTTSATLSIAGVNPAMNSNQFRVLVTSGSGTATSAAATLTVPPVITSPAIGTFAMNQFNNFTFTAAGNPAPTISINVGGALPTGVTFASPVLSGTPTQTFSSSTFITVTASNSGGTATQNFVLQVAPPQAPTITSPPNATFNVDQPGSFTFTAAGSPTPTIQLFGFLPNGLSFNSPILSGTPTTSQGSPFTFTVMATSSSGTATQSFVLTIPGVAPTIATHPTSTTANIGESATFTATVSGNPDSLRWKRQPSGTFDFVDLHDDGIYSGTTSETLTINNIMAAMNGDQFQLVATNSAGVATSSPATLTVNLGTTITTFAGQAGVIGATDATGISARFNGPTGIALAPDGTLYIADTTNHVIRRVTTSGVVTTFAGQAQVSGNTDGTGSAARFSSPQGIAVDFLGNVYVADTFNHTIRHITPSGVVSTFAGLANNPGALDGVGTAARFSFPTAVVTTSFGTLYVADSSNHAIRRISGGFVTTFAGTIGPAGAGFLNSEIGTSARFNTPSALALDNSGNVYVADTFNNVIRRITAIGSVSTFAGTGVAGAADGHSTVAQFNRPYGVAIDTAGNLYVADTHNSTIRKVTAGTGEVTTLAGFPGAIGSTDGAGSTARFFQPYGVAVDSTGNIYVADTRNHTIRRSGSTQAPQILTQPSNQLASVGGSASFTVTASGTPTPSYQWQRQPVNSFGFLNLVNDGINYSGVTTATLTISNATSEMSGDEFRVIVANGVVPAAQSESARLTIGTAPVFTSVASATFQAGGTRTFNVTATSDPAATFSLSGHPSWLSINPSTGLLSGNPPDTTGSPHTFTITANNGISATQTFVLTVTPAVVPPVIVTHPTGGVINQGDTASFAVSATGTAPLLYQWRRDGVAINGATNASLILNNVQPTAAGSYSVVVTNAVGTATSNPATLGINTPPLFVSQPRPQVALAGSSVTFSVAATGGAGLSYQWRRNGVAIPGATGPILTVSNVSAADAGNYDVQVSNAFGQFRSSLAQLTIATGPTAPVIVAQPATRTALIGSSTVLSVAATGVPAPTYQWRKNGALISGANSPTLAFSSVQAGDAAVYEVFISNSAGNVTSLPAILNVIPRSYAGVYFGTFAGGLGNFALYVREDNTGVFLGYLPGSIAPVMSLNLTVNNAGQFTFFQGNIAASAANEGEPPRAAALAPVNVTGSIANDGAVTGSITGGVNATLSATRAGDSGSTQGIAGFYQAGATGSAATAFTIAGPNNQAFVVVQGGTNSDGGLGTVTNAGQVNVITTRTIITETIVTDGSVSGTSTGAVSASFSGASDTQLARQRLVNISSRARVGTGETVAIAGFVIAGQESKPVLIRAVGPTLGTLGVPGVLAAPRLELFRAGNTTAIATNTGIAANRTAIDAAGVQAGAFALGTSGADAAILTTLAPGNYTAVVSSTTTATGVALVEVYDLSAPAPGQKLLNISTRASAGTAENTLIAGFVVPSGSAKRVLIRGIGPGLTPFGVTGVLPQPTLTLISGSTTVAQNTTWSTSADAAAITAAAVQAGAFGLAAQDAALVVTLPPGNYTAQVTGAGGASGVALIEVYELP